MLSGEGGDDASQVIVVGGSLVGLSVAIALARSRIRVDVIERGPRDVEGGGGLGVDVELVRGVTGVVDGPPVCHGPDRDTTAWHLLRDWLLEACHQLPGVTVHHNVSVLEVRDEVGTDVSVVATGGRHWTGRLIVGADGVHSTVRRHVDPTHPSATYAGFILWRAMVDESAVADRTMLPAVDEPSRELYVGPYRLVTYVVPGRGGETSRGARRLNLVWYDPAREDLLRRKGKLDGLVVEGSLGAEDLSEELLTELDTVASRTWPPPWREALGVAIERKQVFGTPVAEYLPRRMVSGRTAMVGDAAHAASPMVGGGFRHGLLDAAALAVAMRGAGGFRDQLAAFEDARLGPSISHVLRSQQASETYRRRTKLIS
jgi:2-polyprenyl-6-methoxyphenol hydroxylase-like FAD-dependent oxidoreductase